MNKQEQQISGNIIDVVNGKIFPGTLQISDGRIRSVTENHQQYGSFILPGFVDAHIHIESSMLTPYEFARVALRHGTVATVSDPHEIANVCGINGVLYMLENAGDALLKFHFGAPSCVPATAFETAGAVLGPAEVETLLKRDDIFYLSEMMNYPGVLMKDPGVMEKIALAKKYGKPVDGHAPGLTGSDAAAYIAAGISTDHECFTKEEALFKLKQGMKILIREGSAAKNFEALHELISAYPDQVMLCSDDKHPDDLLEGHINLLVKRALEKGHDLMKVLRSASVNPVRHYRLPVGLLQPGDPADFIVIDNIQNFNILETWLNGIRVATTDTCLLSDRIHPEINFFQPSEKAPGDLAVRAGNGPMKVITALDGQLITGEERIIPLTSEGFVVSDVDRDILKLAVVNRYRDAAPAMAFIKNFGLKNGAIASTVAHDSHNIIGVGADDESLCKAVNLLMKHKGGLCLVHGREEMRLPLPVAGLMTTGTCQETGCLYASMTRKVQEMGCTLKAPYMTLSFMALLVIPDLKLSDQGLFSGHAFAFTGLFDH